jgi:hypothetical protein
MFWPKSAGETLTYFFNFLLFQTFLIRSHGESNPGLLDASEVL